MTLDRTLGLAGLLAVLTIVFGMLGARPARPLASPRLAPWRLLMLFSFAVLVSLLVHVVSLLRAPAE